MYKYLIDEWENRSKKQKETLVGYSKYLEDVVSPNDIDESIPNLIIFEDMIVEKNLKQAE